MPAPTSPVTSPAPYKHPHDAVIRAYLEGKTVQFKQGNNWIDSILTPDTGVIPRFHPENEWRIKPSTSTIAYRVALFKQNNRKGFFTWICESRDAESAFESDPGFRGWLTAWHTVQTDVADIS